jgi:NAD(P)-dependent dehydrogenase (short-subunit alcohol dehydrogenase family)
MLIYVAVEAEIEGLTRRLARDLGIHNIRVSMLDPG